MIWVSPFAHRIFVTLRLFTIIPKHIPFVYFVGITFQLILITSWCRNLEIISTHALTEKFWLQLQSWSIVPTEIMFPSLPLHFQKPVQPHEKSDNGCKTGSRKKALWDITPSSTTSTGLDPSFVSYPANTCCGKCWTLDSRALRGILLLRLRTCARKKRLVFPVSTGPWSTSIESPFLI